MSQEPKKARAPRRRVRTARKSSRLTLRQRLTLSLLLVGLASLCLAGITYVAFDLLGYRDEQTERLYLQATIISDHVEVQGLPEVTADLRWAVKLQADPHVQRAELYRADETLLSSYERESVEELVEVPGFVAEAWDAHVVHDLYHQGRRLGRVVIVGNPDVFWTRLKNHGSILIALIGVSVLMTLGLSRRVNRRFSDQILDLAHAANAISMRKDYSIRVVKRSDDEIGILVDTFNHMITQIELRDLQLKAEVTRAEAAKIAKAKFLATMSHEIRTPINGILGMTELLLDTRLSSEQGEFTKTVRRSAEGLLAIINDILDFSKGEAGRFELESIPFSLSRVINECLETVSIVACEKDLELCCHVDKGVPLHLHGDPGRLRQVLLNLLSNALKFTSEGEVVLRTFLEKDLEDYSEIRIEIQDTGIGIAEDRLDRLFKSFSQVDASNTRKYGGTGLGLAICKQIVEAMGGTLYVRSNPDAGSTFGFRVRLRKAPAAADPLAYEAPEGLRILVAESNTTSRESLEYMLKDENDVIAVSSGLEARVTLMRAMKTRPFDLVMMDLRLIDEFGPASEDTERELPDVPLLLIAPVTQLTSASAIAWKGRKACLARPVKREELFWCLYEVLKPDALAAVPSLLPANASDEDADLSGVRVLVAEDHPVNQKITTRFLDKLGVAWELAENGEEAVEKLRNDIFDLVLMDVQMPVMDGLEATLTIRRYEELTGEHVPIVAMTANAMEQDRRRCREAGFDDYLVKPVKLEQLRSHILKWTVGTQAA